MPIHSATLTTDGTTTIQVLPDDRSRRWYVIQNRATDAQEIGPSTLTGGGDGLFLSPDAMGDGSGGRLEVRQGHENDKTPCHAVYAYGQGSGGSLQVIWATEDSTD